MTDFRVVKRGTIAGLRGPGLTSADITVLDGKVADAEAAAAAAGAAETAAEGFAADAQDAADSVPVPATQTEVDEASAAKGVLAAQLGKIYARMILLEEQAGLPHVAQVAPVTDDFTGDGNLHGRALSDGSLWTVDAGPGITVVPTCLTTVSGKLGKNGGTANNFGHMTAGSVYSYVSQVFAILPTTTSYPVYHVAFDAAAPGTKFEGLRAVCARTGESGNITLSGYDGAVGGNPTIQALGAVGFNGDTIALGFHNASGVDYVELYLNGRRCRDDAVISGNGWALTGKFGYLGSIDVGMADSITVADRDTEAWTRLYAPARVVQIEPDGTTIFRLTVEYGGALNALTYSIIDHATGLPVAGHDEVAATSFVGADGDATALTVAASLGTGAYHVEIQRNGLVNQIGAVAQGKAYGPAVHVGEVIIFNGQSNAQRLWNSITTTLGISKPTEGLAFRIDAFGTVAQNARYQYPLSANTPLAMGYATIAAVTGRAVSFICGGLSGSLIAARGVGTATHLGLLDGITHGGGHALSVCHVDGENDALSGTSGDAYKVTLNGIYDDIETYLGHAIKVVMRPIGACWGSSAGTDASVQAMRRTQWEVCQGSSRYVVGGWCMDLQHVAADSLHLGPDDIGAPGAAEMVRRMMFAVMKARGLVVNDRNGPSIASVVKINNQTIRVIYDLNGASGLEVANTGYASIFSGGMRFATSSAFASLVAPTGVTINAVAGTQQSIDFAFASNSFTGSAYVGGPYGKNPFNASDDAATNADMANKASMVRGLFAGEVSIPVQPYYHSSGNDYMVAA